MEGVRPLLGSVGGARCGSSTAPSLRQKEIAREIPYARPEGTLPAVFTPDEVVRLFKAVPNLKIRTALITIYAAGLRVSEVVALTARDINSERMVIFPGCRIFLSVQQRTQLKSGILYSVVDHHDEGSSDICQHPYSCWPNCIANRTFGAAGSYA